MMAFSYMSYASGVTTGGGARGACAPPIEWQKKKKRERERKEEEREKGRELNQ